MTPPWTVAEHTDYDAIAGDYRSSKQLSFRSVIEGHTLSRLLGDVTSRSVLDRACGEGFHTRRIRASGASRVLGVDLSVEMIRLAEAEERREPLGCLYRQGDAATFRHPEPFDCVCAAYLFNHAPDFDTLLAFARSAAAALRPGGRCIGFNDNPHVDPRESPTYAPYGFEKLGASPRREGDAITYRMRSEDGGTFDIVNDYLAPSTYEAAFREAGFEDFRWEGPWLDPSGEGNAHWDTFLANPPLIGLSARRGA